MFEQAFAEFLSAWDFHQSLRERGASIPELSRSRATLDARRERMVLSR